MERKSRWASRLLALLLSAAFLCPAASAAQIWGYQEGLAKVSENGLWGFADSSGKIVVPIRYQSVLDFTLGTAQVQLNGKLGVIRQDGTQLIRPEYDSLSNLGYGLYIAQRGGLFGVVSLNTFSSKLGGETQELYPISYSDIQLRLADGLEVLVMRKDGVETVVPTATLPALMAEREVPSARFPLIRGRVPSFSDVGARDWFTVWVDIAYNLGLMEGVGGGTFSPGGTLTVAETLKMAAFLESQYQGDDFHQRAISGSPWYRSSVAYCVASGIITEGEFDDYERPVTRAEMARVFAATTLGRTMPERNSLERVRSALPDVKPGDYAADAIYRLYATGIFSGTDGALTFNPQGVLTRAEAAAVVSRMARTEQRVTLWPTAYYRSAAAEPVMPTR